MEVTVTEPVSTPAPVVCQDSAPLDGLDHVRRYLCDFGEIT